MPFDFSEEAKLTNQQLAGELAKITPLTQDQLNKVLPRKVDKERFAELLAIVQSSASQNKKLASITENFSELGGVVVKLLTSYFKPI